MILTHPNRDNIEKIKVLYKKNKDALGIPFGRVFDAMIDNQDFVVCISDNGEIMGFCGIQYRPRLGYFEIEHLCVDTLYRKQHIATVMLKTLISRYRLCCLPFCALAIDGMENNTFYDRISKGYTKVPRKHCTLRRYIIDVDKVII